MTIDHSSKVVLKGRKITWNFFSPLLTTISATSEFMQVNMFHQLFIIMWNLMGKLFGSVVDMTVGN